MIKFFISSTFRDMFGERNLLQKEILPELREFGRLKGEYVDLCDLRWGMNPQEGEWDDRLMAIMDVCIHEIDNCNNCFIAFLGDSYGTVEAEKFKSMMLVRECKNIAWQIWMHAYGLCH